MMSSNNNHRNRYSEFTVEIQTEKDTQNFAEKLAAQLQPPLWVELEGSLGAGKTTLTRYVLTSLGHQGSVKSPTYTLVEPYQLKLGDFFHFDLYRLGDPEELDYLGIRDYLNRDTIAFVEWPSKGDGFLPSADLRVKINMENQKRLFRVSALSEKGEILVKALQ